MTDDNLPPLPEPVDYGYREEGTWVQQLCFTHDQMQAYARAAILQERERCAKVCEEFEAEWSRLAKGNRDGTYDNMQDAAEQCAAAIREGRK